MYFPFHQEGQTTDGKKFTRLAQQVRTCTSIFQPFLYPNPQPPPLIAGATIVTNNMSAILRFSLLLAVISVVSFLTGGDMDTSSSSTTVVILNWSRPFNLNKIVSVICQHLDESIVPSIIIWNNNPKKMIFEVCSILDCV